MPHFHCLCLVQSRQAESYMYFLNVSPTVWFYGCVVELVIVGVGLCMYAHVKYVAIYAFCKPALCPCAPPLAAQVSPEFSFPCVFCGDCR